MRRAHYAMAAITFGVWVGACSDSTTDDGTTSGDPGTGGTGAGTTSTGGFGGDAPGGFGGKMENGNEACGMCADTAASGTCETVLDTCEAEAACDELAGCIQDCIQDDDSAACYQGCKTTLGGSTTLWQPVETCMCGECIATCPIWCGDA